MTYEFKNMFNLFCNLTEIIMNKYVEAVRRYVIKCYALQANDENETYSYQFKTYDKILSII